MTTQNAGEQHTPVHQEMFRSLLRTPHRQGDATLALHKEMFERDPNFYGLLAFYAVGLGNCVIRDVNEIFLAVLFDSPYEDHRDAAYVLMQDLPPYQVGRVVNYFTGYRERIRHASYEPAVEPAPGLTIKRNTTRNGTEVPRKTVKLGNRSDVRARLLKKGLINHSTRQFTIEELLLEHKGLGNRRVKGTLRQAVRAYLRLREQEDRRGQMEGALIRASRVLRHLYRKTNLLPMNDENSWINRYLFRGEVEEGSRLEGIRKLQASDDPAEQSEIIMEYKLPWVIASSAIKDMTPSVMVALIDAMSPQELMQNLSALQKRGAMDNSDIKKLIESKLSKAKKAKRVDALKGAVASGVEGLDEDIKKAVTEVTDTQLKRHGQVRAKTALLIDKSYSMASAIELGKKLAAVIAQACGEENPVDVWMFDAMPTQIRWKASDGDITKHSDWVKKLRMYRANGGTAPSTVIRAMTDARTEVEQIVVVTDEGENQPNQFAMALKQYEATMGHMPNVVIIRMRGMDMSTRMESSLKAAGINVDVLEADKSDTVSIPNLLQLLSRKSVFDLVQEVLALDLPDRAAWENKNGIDRAEINRRKIKTNV